LDAGRFALVPLLEREGQVASLQEYAGGPAGDGRLVFIAGEAGVGKSALVEHVQRDLSEGTWCWGRGSRDEGCAQCFAAAVGRGLNDGCAG
jgi:hypothetical protein